MQFSPSSPYKYKIAKLLFLLCLIFKKNCGILYLINVGGNMNCENINCNCGKLIAKLRNGKLYLYCKSCKKEIPIEIEKLKEKMRAKSQDK